MRRLYNNNNRIKTTTLQRASSRSLSLVRAFESNQIAPITITTDLSINHHP